MTSVRRWVWVLAGLSTALPAAFLAIVLLPLVVPAATLPWAVGKALLAGWVATAIARGVLAHRLNPAEQIVIRFWALTPQITLVMATALGALPLLIVNSLASSFGWSSTSAQVGVRGVVLVVAAFAGLAVWSFWIRIRASLPDVGAPGARAA